MPTIDEERRVWEREYRQSVNDRLDRQDTRDEQITKQITQHAQIIERILARLDVLEAKPREARAWFNSANGGLYTLIAVIALAIALLSHVTFH